MNIGFYCLESNGWTVQKEVINPPTPRIYTAKVVGKDGLVDLSEVATGRVQYDNIEMSATITRTILGDESMIYNDIQNHINGVFEKIWMNSDTYKEYRGRVIVKSVTRDRSQIVANLSISADPYPTDSQSMWLYAREPGDDTLSVLKGSPRKFEIIRPLDYTGDVSIHLTLVDGYRVEEFDVDFGNGDSLVWVKTNDWSYQSINIQSAVEDLRVRVVFG